jgi:hypothetical protein
MKWQNNVVSERATLFYIFSIVCKDIMLTRVPVNEITSLHILLDRAVNTHSVVKGSTNSFFWCR